MFSQKQYRETVRLHGVFKLIAKWLFQQCFYFAFLRKPPQRMSMNGSKVDLNAHLPHSVFSKSSSCVLHRLKAWLDIFYCRYWIELFTQYNKLQKFQPSVHVDAVPLEIAVMRPEQTFSNIHRNCTVCWISAHWSPRVKKLMVFVPFQLCFQSAVPS